MGTYGLAGVIQAWELDKLTTEQAIGQILLLLAELNERITALERAQEEKRRRRKKAN